MGDLSWKTEDEIEPPSSFVSRSLKSKSHRRLVLSLTIVFILLVTGVVYIRLTIIAARDRALVDIDVRTAFMTWREAVEKGDTEILKSIVAGDEPAWYSTQKQLIEEGMLLDRQGLGFMLSTEEKITENPRYELSHDWRSVSFYFTSSYFNPSALADGTKFDLEHSVTFRREGARWLYGQPPEQFWGDNAVEKFEYLTASFSERDRSPVSRLTEELDLDIKELCLEKTGSICPEDEQVKLTFDMAPDLLSQYSSPGAVVFQDGAFLLPTPSLIGKPVDEAGYRAMYNFYSGIILPVISANLASPIAEPDQTIQLLCYEEFGRRPKLFRYDLKSDRWDVLLPDRSFRHLGSLPGDEGLLLQQFSSEGPRRWISLVSFIDGQVENLYDYLSNTLQAFPIEQPLSTSGQNILLRDHSAQSRTLVFRLLYGSSCAKPGCEFGDLDGFPAWSPDGWLSLLWQDGLLALGDNQGRRIREIGEGFSPFWFNDELYGYSQFQADSISPRTVLYVGDPAREEKRILLSSMDLAGALEGDLEGAIYIQYATVNPASPLDLIIVSRDYNGEPYRNYIFNVALTIANNDLAVERISLLGTFPGKLSGIPSAESPKGTVPILFSPDGSMLTVSKLDDFDQNWEIFVIDLSTGNTSRYVSRYPSYTFTYPYFDWSLDSEWLVIVDKGLLRLIAPRYDFVRLIPNSNHTCSQVAWVNN